MCGPRGGQSHPKYTESDAESPIGLRTPRHKRVLETEEVEDVEHARSGGLVAVGIAGRVAEAKVA